MLMYYIDVLRFLEHPEKDWEAALEEDTSSPLPRHRTTGGLDMVLVSGLQITKQVQSGDSCLADSNKIVTSTLPELFAKIGYTALTAR